MCQWQKPAQSIWFIEQNDNDLFGQKLRWRILSNWRENDVPSAGNICLLLSPKWLTKFNEWIFDQRKRSLQEKQSQKLAKNSRWGGEIVNDCTGERMLWDEQKIRRKFKGQMPDHICCRSPHRTPLWAQIHRTSSWAVEMGGKLGQISENDVNPTAVNE